MNNKEKNKILESITDMPNEYFDGHTEFKNMTPEERLVWLSEGIYFVYHVAQNNPSLGCAKFFQNK